MFALVDCNNFYVSCERAFDASIKRKPVVVLSNNDGCIISRSQEAKDMGIKMGEPYFKRKQWLEEKGVRVFSSNYTLYGDMSSRVMELLNDFTPELEVYSIDEAFLRLDGLVHLNLKEYAQKIRGTIGRGLGIPVCVGIGPTKTLAKLANHLAKEKRQQSGGVWIIRTEREWEEALRAVWVKDVWGVGRQYAARLQAAGVERAFDLTQCSVDWVRRQLGGVVGVRVLKELQGKPCLQTVLPQEKKSIASTRSFGKPVQSLAQLQEAVAAYVTRAAEKLRRQGSAAGAITVFIHTNRYAPVEQYFKSITLEMPVATDSTVELVQRAVEGVKQIFRPLIQYGKAGVVLTDLVPVQAVQPDLFAQSTVVAHQELMKSLDLLNQRWGSGTVVVAAVGMRQEWKMLKGMCSQRFTTHWNELLQVRC
ncbi:Y-family DNA polymerase [Rufibacter immobilis]|uniref:Y-family DNA polymerase n=1 Tax=Rufibacter immobilis TaxID=1348778 RepID=A0A3M9MZ73_9BACT|nr:Y-family DNA polymerase [Rufibacter immobilis]RNI30851.1 Y-family DNA polymerase [Rufibacter immobilis]